MSRGRSTGLAVVVHWEGEPVGQHYLLAGQQITVGSGRAADLRVSGRTVRRCQPLLQARAEGYQLLLPPGGRAVCRATSLAPTGVYRAPERRVYEAGAHPGDDQALCFDHDSRISIAVGSWHLTVRPTNSVPDWAEHTTQVVTQGFKQSLTWHQDRQAQLKRGAAAAPMGRWWPFVLGSAAVHAALLFVIFAVPPAAIYYFDCFPHSCDGVETVTLGDWSARRHATIRTHVDLKHRRPTIRTSVDLDPAGGGIEPPLNRALRARLRAALKRHRGFLRACIPNRRLHASLLLVRLEADGRGKIAQTALPDFLGLATRTCLQTALLRWELPATGWPLEVTTELDLTEQGPKRSSGNRSYLIREDRLLEPRRNLGPPPHPAVDFNRPMSMPAEKTSPLAALPLMLVALVLVDPLAARLEPPGWMGRSARRARRAARSIRRRRRA